MFIVEISIVVKIKNKHWCPITGMNKDPTHIHNSTTKISYIKSYMTSFEENSCKMLSRISQIQKLKHCKLYLKCRKKKMKHTCNLKIYIQRLEVSKSSEEKRPKEKIRVSGPDQDRLYTCMYTVW